MNTTKFGKKYKFGDIVLALIQFVDSGEIKTRPALVLFEEYGNIVLAGITSNPNMSGIPITKEEGMYIYSVIKLNYIMTVDKTAIKKYLFKISENKKKLVKEEIITRIK